MNRTWPASVVHSYVCRPELSYILLSLIMQRIVICRNDQSRRNAGKVQDGDLACDL
jgi:hypothetical protein